MASAAAESIRTWPDGMAGSLRYIQVPNLTTAHGIGIATAVVFLSLLYKFSSPQMDPREPPVLKPGIPLVGHLVGLVRYGVDYFDVLRYAVLAARGTR